MKRIIALLMALLMLLSLFACGDSGNEKQKDESTSADTTVKADDTTEALRYPEDGPNYLPEQTYNGYTYKVLLAGSGIGGNFNDFGGESKSGYLLVSEAIAVRNAKIESDYDVVIEYVENFGSGGGNGVGYKAVMEDFLAAESKYSICEISTYDSAQLAIGNFLYDLNMLPHLDCSQKWWDKDAYDDLTINDRLFFTTGDISSVDNMATHCILFSKDLAEMKNISVSDIYKSVDDGKWTLDTFNSLCANISEDVNGDDVMNVEDRYAILTWNDAIQASLVGARVRIASVNENGEAELTLYSDRSDSVVNKFAEYFFDAKQCFNYSVVLQKSEYDVQRVRMFDEKRALFSCTVLNTVPKHRDSDLDFGILPYPKFEEAQEEYGSYVGASYSVMICVEKYITDEDMPVIGALTDAIAYESYATVQPAYSDQTLIGRDVMDEESIACLDIIFGNRCFDIGIYYKIGSYTGKLTSMMKVSRNLLSSYYNSQLKQAKKEIEVLNQKFAEWKN